MNYENREWLCDNIFIKCIYSAHLNVGSAWSYSDKKTNYCNLVLICKGQGIFTCNNQTYIVKEGDIIFFPMGVSRTMRSDGGELTFRSINFIYSFIFENNRKWTTTYHDINIKIIRHIADKILFRRIERLFIQIQKYYLIPQNSADFHMRYYATELIQLLITDNSKSISFSEQNMIDNSIKYMSVHFKEKITLNQLSEISGKSISYYGKIFKKITGVSPIEYLLLIRISYAKKLLENGTSITETAQACGFASLYYFSKAFKKKELMSPSEYITLYKKKRDDN